MAFKIPGTGIELEAKGVRQFIKDLRMVSGTMYSFSRAATGAAKLPAAPLRAYTESIRDITVAYKNVINTTLKVGKAFGLVSTSGVIAGRGMASTARQTTTAFKQMEQAAKQSRTVIGQAFDTMAEKAEFVRLSLADAFGKTMTDVFQGAIRSIMQTATSAGEGVANYERLRMSLNTLIATEIRRNSGTEKTIVLGTTTAKLTDDQIAKLDDLRENYRLTEISIAEQVAKMEAIAEKSGTVNTEYEKQGIKLEQLREKLVKYGTDIQNISSIEGKEIAITQKVIEGQLTMAEAREKASGATEELLGFITQLAIKSPFTEQGVSDAVKMSIAYGFVTQGAEDVADAQKKGIVTAQRFTQAMVDFVSGAGRSEESMELIALALGQVKTRGKLAGQEIRQLTEQGVPVLDILARAFGKTTAEVQAMVENGMVPADKAINALVESWESDFAGAAAEQAGSLAGLTASLQDIRNITLRELFGGVMKGFKPVMQSVVDSMSTPENFKRLRDIGELIGSAIERIISVGMVLGRVLKKVFSTIMRAASPFLEKMSGFAGKTFESFLKGAEGLASVLSVFIDNVEAGVDPLNAWDSLMRNIFPAPIAVAASKFAEIVGKVVGLFGDVSKASSQTKGMGAIFTSLGDKRIVGAISQVSRVIMSIIEHMKGFAPIIGQIVGAIMSMDIGSAFDRLAPIFVSINGLINQIMQNAPAWREMWAGLVDSIMTSWAKIQPYIGERVDGIIKSISEFINDASKFWKEHGDEVMQIVQFTFTVVAGTIGSAVILLLGIVDAALNMLQGNWSGAWEAITEAVTTAIDFVLSLVGTNLEEFNRQWTANFEMAWIIVSTIFNRIVEFIRNTWTNIFNIFSGAFTNVIRIILTKWLEVKSTFDNGIKAVRGLFEGFVEMFQSFGGDLMDGVIRGILLKVTLLKNTVVDAIKDTIKKARDALGAASPAKVPEKMLGVPFSQGVGVGIMKGFDDVKSKVRDLFSSLSYSFGGPSYIGEALGIGQVSHPVGSTYNSQRNTTVNRNVTIGSVSGNYSRQQSPLTMADDIRAILAGI